MRRLFAGYTQKRDVKKWLAFAVALFGYHERQILAPA
jgi:hypothetical protein